MVAGQEPAQEELSGPRGQPVRIAAGDVVGDDVVVLRGWVKAGTTATYVERRTKCQVSYAILRRAARAGTAPTTTRTAGAASARSTPSTVSARSTSWLTGSRVADWAVAEGDEGDVGEERPQDGEAGPAVPGRQPVHADPPVEPGQPGHQGQLEGHEQRAVEAGAAAEDDEGVGGEARPGEQDGDDDRVGGQDRLRAGAGLRLGAEGRRGRRLAVGGARGSGHRRKLHPPGLSFSCRATFKCLSITRLWSARYGVRTAGGAV
ncbi:hypothetical protein FM21_19915 [Streptomyces mutabilis]|uniref:Uncharacterized protein n=1 Tax=Streptomyces mutabilis TaxID=67332 RepID=A0A086MW39_9ACTN|nr:hypothetical protein FM21_19915 [Streptomyces mutabilis]